MAEHDETDAALTAELVRRYEAGETIDELVADSPLSFRRIRRILLDTGITLRPQARRVPPAPPGLVNGYAAGNTIRQLARIHGLTYGQTRRMLLQEGVELRARGGKH